MKDKVQLVKAGDVVINNTPLLELIERSRNAFLYHMCNDIKLIEFGKYIDKSDLLILANIDFENIDFSGVDLSYAGFYNNKFTNCLFKDMTARFVDFSFTYIDKCEFENVTFNNDLEPGVPQERRCRKINSIVVKNSSIKNCIFNKIEINNISEIYSNIFRDCIFVECDFADMHLTDNKFNNVEILLSELFRVRSYTLEDIISYISCKFNSFWRRSVRKQQVKFTDCEFIHTQMDRFTCTNNNFIKNKLFTKNLIKYDQSKNALYMIQPPFPEGKFIGWKIVVDSTKTKEYKKYIKDTGKYNDYDKIKELFYFVKLEIPEDAKRACNPFFENTIRVDKAKVIGIYDVFFNETNLKNIEKINYVYNEKGPEPIEIKTNYILNEYVYPDKFDESLFKTITSGIHLYINRYYLYNDLITSVSKILYDELFEFVNEMEEMSITRDKIESELFEYFMENKKDE